MGGLIGWLVRGAAGLVGQIYFVQVLLEVTRPQRRAQRERELARRTERLLASRAREDTALPLDLALRWVGVARSGDAVTALCVNEGAAASDIRVEGAAGEMRPDRLPGGATGELTLNASDAADMPFTLAYRDATGQALTQRFVLRQDSLRVEPAPDAAASGV